MSMYSYKLTQGPIYTLKSKFLPPGFKKWYHICMCVISRTKFNQDVQQLKAKLCKI